MSVAYMPIVYQTNLFADDFFTSSIENDFLLVINADKTSRLSNVQTKEIIE